MSAFKKIAVTMPAETYKALERARGRLGKSRSEVVAAAVTEWLRGLDANETRRRYVDAYLRVPESRELEGVVAAATAGWSSWEPGAPLRASETMPRRRARR